MDVISFERALVTIAEGGEVIFAFFDGAVPPVTNSRCVALLSCRAETAAALSQSIGSALKAQGGQADSNL